MRIRLARSDQARSRGRLSPPPPRAGSPSGLRRARLHLPRLQRNGKSEGGSRFRGNPYLFLGARPFREEHLRSYILAQQRAGRRLSEIVGDRYVRRLGSERFFWSVVQDARTLAAFNQDIRAAIRDCEPRR
jgi:hypothetical protein